MAPAKTIYIVDDEPLLTEMLTDYLTGHFPDLKIESFPTGEKCLEAMATLPPDLVVLDYYLNSREKEAANGIDILKELKKRSKPLPVVMLSSQPNYGTAAQTIYHGAIHYVSKGEDAFDEIRQLVKSNLQV